ncbi:MAG: pre-peptidase C-terminal domain-containing protein [Verrucomicrobiales bacterium]|nr:pre-peptidase C-terminal domain-containing protein [Verrucomicrobiales bacterium]
MNAIQSSILPSGSGNPARTIAGRRAAAGVLALTLLAGVGQAETEPNDRVGEANVAPSSGAVPGVISPAGDVDWYQVTVPGPGRLNLAIVSPPANMRTEIAIYGRHTEWLSVYRSAINSGDDTFLAYDVVTPGAYFVRVRDLNNGISAGSYSLDSTFTAAPDASEPNDRIGQAKLITSPVTTGKIFPRGEEDWFRVFVPAGSHLACQLTAPAELRGELALYNADFGWMSVYSSAVNPGDTVHLDYDAAAAGMYHIRLRDLQGLAHLSDYQLTVSGGTIGYLPPETPVTTEVEANDSLGRANRINPGVLVSGSIAAAHDEDWYTLVPTRTGQMTVTMTAAPSTLRLRLRVFSDSGASLVSAQAGLPGGLFSLTYDIRTLDRLYFQVVHLGAESSPEPYQFNTAVVPVEDPYEPNNDYGDARPLQTVNQIQGWFFPASDQDWYRIEVTEPGQVTATLSNLPQNIVPRIDLYDLSLGHLAGQAGTAGTDLQVIGTVSTPGAYIVRVLDARGGESTAPYTLTIFGADFTLFAPVARIDRIDPGAIVVGDTIEFEGSGTDADGSVTGYEWRSDIDGVVGAAAQFTTTTLSIGTHTVYFRVQDNDGVWSTEVKELVYVGSTVSEEIEPNGSFFPANEVALNRPLTGKIDAPGDEDFFKVYVPGDGRLTAELSNVPTNLRMELSFYNRYWEWISRYSSATTPGDDVSVAWDFTGEGFVYLRVRDLAGQSDATFTYTLALNFEPAADAFEPNNQLLDAVELESDTLQARLFPGGEEDWYKVWVEAGETLVATVDPVPADVRAEVALYGRNREWLSRYESAVNAGDPVSASVEAGNAGFFYIRVRPVAGYNWTDTYQLAVSGARPGYAPGFLPVTMEVEPNDTLADGQAIAPGSPVQGELADAPDADWYHFLMPTPGIVEVRLEDVPAALTGALRIYRDDYAQLAYRAASNPGDLLALQLRVTRPGVYHILVDGVGSSYAAGQPYSLVLQQTPVVDALEPNDRFQDAVALVQQNRAQGYLFDAGDHDWYRVHSEAGSTLRISLGEVPAAIRPQLEVYNHDAGRIASKLASNDGQAITLTLDITETADYSIRVRDVADNSFAVEPYTVVIDGAVFDSYVPLALIDEVTPNPADAGETVSFVGHGEDVDGTIIGHEWSSSIDGVFSISQTAASAGLTPGVHEIHYRVKDNDQNWSPAVSTRLFFGVPAPAEIEPNNIAGSATPMEYERQYQGLMDGAGDQDWYRVGVEQAGRLTVQAVNPLGEAMRLNLEFYTPDLEWASVYTTASNDADPVTLTWDVTQAGYYYLRVRDAGNRAGGVYTVSATLVSPPDPFEDNPDFANAAQLAPNDQVQAHLFPRGEEDFYTVAVDTPGSLALALSPVPADLRLELAVYGPNLEWLSVYRTANNPGDEVFLTYDAGQATTLYLRVRDVSNGANPTEAYTLTSVFTPAPDDFEPNPNPSAAPLLTSSPVQAHVFPGGDEDFYRVYAPPGSTLEFIADQAPSNLRLELALYNANYGWMSVYRFAEQEGDPVTLTHSPAAGYYYLRVRDRDNDRSAAQTYRLTVNGAQLDHVLPTEPGAIEIEPNDDLAEATLVGTAPVTGSLNGNVDWFAFDVEAPSELTISVTVPPAHRSMVRLYNPAGGQIASREAENPGDPSAFTRPLGTPGRYYVSIADASGVASEAPYQLTLDLVPVPDPKEPNGSYATAVAVMSGAPAQGYLFPPGDQDWYQIEIVEPGRLLLDVVDLPPTVQIEVRLYNQNLALLLNQTSMHGGDPFHREYELRDPGLYRIMLHDRGDDAYGTTAYTFTATFLPAGDPNEPNDRFRDATPLAAVNQARGMIQPAGDVDWYRFDVTDAGPVRVQISQTTGWVAQLELYDDSRSRVANTTARNPGEVLLLTYNATVPDTYYLLLRDRSGSRVSPESYVLTIEGGAFGAFYPIAEMPLTFVPNPAPPGALVQLTGEATDPDGTPASFSWASDRDGWLGAGDSLTVAALSEGVHEIGFQAVDDSGLASGRVDQRLVVATRLETELEPNNNVESAIPLALDTWVVGRTRPGGDHDYYKVYVDQCGLLEVRVDAVPAGMRPDLTVYDAAGGWLSQYSTAERDGQWVAVAFYAGPAWYVIRVRDANERGQSATYALHCGLAQGYDVHEPNGSFAQATPIGTNVTIDDANLCPNGEEDWYRIEFEEAGRLRLELDGLPSTFRPELALYNQDLSWISVYSSGINPGDHVPLAYNVGRPQVLYVRVRNLDYSPVPQPYALHVDFDPVPDPFEPNDSGGVATLLTSAEIDAYIFGNNEEDWYRIHLDAGATLSLHMTQVPLAMRGELAMYGPNLEWLSRYSTANNPGDLFHLEYTAPADGMYFVRVRDADGGAHLAPYHLAIGGGNPGFEPPFNPVTSEVEPNGVWSAASDINLDTLVTGTTDPGNDHDFFRVWVNSPGVLRVAHTGVPSEIISEMRIYNRHVSEVGYRRTTNPGEDNLLEAPATTVGYYYIVVRDYGQNNASDTAWNLRVTHVPVVDPHEPNDTLGQAAPLGGPTVSAHLFDGGDVDWYRVYVREPGTLSLSLDDVPVANRPRLRIYDANGGHLGTYVNTNPGVGGDEVLTQSASVPGFYYVRVNDEDGHYAEGTYTLRITGADFSLAPRLAAIGDRTIDETIAYAFTVFAQDPDNPEDLVFSASNLPPGAGFDPMTRTFMWTPARGQAGVYPGVHFEVSDGAFTDSEDITLTVRRLDQAPVLAAIGDKWVQPETELVFQLSATDPDSGDALTFAAASLPSGAGFDPATRTFRWTPTTGQIGTYPGVMFSVSDGTWTDSEWITIEVSDALDPYEAWLREHFTEAERNNPAVSGRGADPDQDDSTNGDEFEADTDPRDDGSVLRITRITVLGAGVEVDWQGGVEAIQYVERKQALDNRPEGWVILRTVQPGTPVSNSLTDPGAGEDGAFYRIRARRP